MTNELFNQFILKKKKLLIAHKEKNDGKNILKKRLSGFHYNRLHSMSSCIEK